MLSMIFSEEEDDEDASSIQKSLEGKAKKMKMSRNNVKCLIRVSLEE